MARQDSLGANSACSDDSYVVLSPLGIEPAGAFNKGLSESDRAHPAARPAVAATVGLRAGQATPATQQGFDLAASVGTLCHKLDLLQLRDLSDLGELKDSPAESPHVSPSAEPVGDLFVLPAHDLPCGTVGNGAITNADLAQRLADAQRGRLLTLAGAENAYQVLSKASKTQNAARALGYALGCSRIWRHRSPEVSEVGRVLLKLASDEAGEECLQFCRQLRATFFSDDPIKLLRRVVGVSGRCDGIRQRGARELAKQAAQINPAVAC